MFKVPLTVTVCGHKTMWWPVSVREKENTT